MHQIGGDHRQRDRELIEGVGADELDEAVLQFGAVKEPQARPHQTSHPGPAQLQCQTLKFL